MADKSTAGSTVQDDGTQHQETTAPEAAPGAAAAPAFDRTHPAFLAVTKQATDERAKAADVQAKLDEILNKEKKDQADAEKKALEERGEYAAILKQKDAEIEALTAAHTRAMLESKLKVSLLSAGANNDLFLEGAVGRYPGDTDGIDKYVETLKGDENNAVFFAQNESPQRPGIPGAQGGTPAASTNIDWRQIKQDLRDPQKAEEASRALTEFAKNNNGGLPPGFQ